ncbi:MAG: hypothetical protein PHT58_07355 [Eubacteriales bacterium]|nr:hypothetical protein [Eubacteriales bacterium]
MNNEITPYCPKHGERYNNHGGGTYMCIDKRPTQQSATMQNAQSGWTLVAYGIGMYPDGTIEWDYSKGLGFRDLTAQQIT